MRKRKKRILLLMNCYEREQYIAEMIQDELFKIDEIECKILYWNRGINEKEIYCFSPQILLTFPLTTLPLIKLVARIKLVCNPTVVTFVTEGYVDFTYENPNMIWGYYDYAPELVDYSGVWGMEYGEHLWDWSSQRGTIKYKNSIRVFGYPLWEHKHLQRIKGISSYERKILDLIEGSSKTILILSGFPTASKEKDDILNSIDAYDVTSDEKDKQINELLLCRDEMRMFRDQFYSLVMEMAKENPNMTFLLKLHPKEIEILKAGKGYDYSIFDSWKNISVLTEDNTVGIYIDKADAVVHFGSTAAWEAYICGVPTLNIVSKELKITKYNPGETYDFKEKDKILNWIKNIDEQKIQNEEYDKYVKENFNYDRDKDYTPSRDIARFLYDHCDALTYSLYQYVEYSDVDNSFRKLLIKLGVFDMISLKWKSGGHKIGLALRRYEKGKL